MKPCDICLEKECKAEGGIGSCDCANCAVKDKCPKKLNATIRITLKCTQACTHCCYDCSPKKEVHMTVAMARKISEFLKNNEVYMINLMGGEIFCNPNWKEILDLIIPTVKIIRIVSNGDWAKNEPEFAKHISKYNNNPDHFVYVCISKDQWHTNKNIELAAKLLTKHKVVNKTSDLNETEFGLVPVGRSQFEMGLYSMFGCYCHNPEKQYSFLIDEKGLIYKCGFGVWDYAEVEEYLDGGFPARFKDFNKVFYSTFIPSCSRCSSSYQFHYHDRKEKRMKVATKYR